MRLSPAGHGEAATSHATPRAQRTTAQRNKPAQAGCAGLEQRSNGSQPFGLKLFFFGPDAGPRSSNLPFGLPA